MNFFRIFEISQPIQFHRTNRRNKIHKDIIESQRISFYPLDKALYYLHYYKKLLKRISYQRLAVILKKKLSRD